LAEGGNMATVALAGTRANTHNSPFTNKEEREQDLVTQYIGNLLPAISLGKVDIEMASIQHTAALSHIRSDIHFAAGLGLTLPLAAAALHPTPATLGNPRYTARNHLTQLEPEPRLLYAGYLGYIDEKGLGALYVNLRCALLGKNQATYYAGAGIVKGSVPDAEYEETTAKIDVLRSLLS
jgi:isochorismate synthase